jgi:hypothetical protein
MGRQTLAGSNRVAARKTRQVAVTWAKAARVGESGEVDLGLLPKNVRHQDSIRQEAKT